MWILAKKGNIYNVFQLICQQVHRVYFYFFLFRGGHIFGLLNETCNKTGFNLELVYEKRQSIIIPITSFC